MKKFILLSILFALLSSAQAQEKKVASEDKPSEGLENLQLAYQLAEYGYKTFSAEALVTAARIISDINTQELEYESYKQDSESKGKVNKPGDNKYDIPGILEAAKKYADEDDNILASISEIEKANQTTRGRVGGPGEKYAWVYGDGIDIYEISFIESRLAEIIVWGDGDTDLDLYIYDSNGNLIKFDDDYTDRCYVSWVPLWTGRYIVKIVNRGPVSNSYHLLTN